MMVTIAQVTGSARAPLSERGHDLYQTPPEAVHALMRVERLPVSIWEPACGPGAIARILVNAGHSVLATDLVDYASPHQDAAGWDFLMERTPPPGIDCIITNPPFKNADAFVARAMALCPKVIMLLRLAFLESERRRGILDGGMLARVHVFRNRLPMMHRDAWAGPKATSSLAFVRLSGTARMSGRPCSTAYRGNRREITSNRQLTFLTTPPRSCRRRSSGACISPSPTSCVPASRRAGCGFMCPTANIAPSRPALFAAHGRVAGGIGLHPVSPPNGLFHALELKRKGEEPSDDQYRFLWDVDATGGVWGWADCYDSAKQLLHFWGAIKRIKK